MTDPRDAAIAAARKAAVVLDLLGHEQAVPDNIRQLPLRMGRFLEAALRALDAAPVPAEPSCIRCDVPLSSIGLVCTECGDTHRTTAEALAWQKVSAAEFDRGRTEGRADVAKYSRAIGEIEGALGIAGAVPLSMAVDEVRALVADRDRLAAELARLRALVRHLELAHDCTDCDAIRAALEDR